MILNIKAINDLYSERYITTLDMINNFHEMIKDEEFVLENADKKIATVILNNLLSEKNQN